MIWIRELWDLKHLGFCFEGAFKLLQNFKNIESRVNLRYSEITWDCRVAILPVNLHDFITHQKSCLPMREVSESTRRWTRSLLQFCHATVCILKSSVWWNLIRTYCCPCRWGSGQAEGNLPKRSGSSEPWKFTPRDCFGFSLELWQENPPISKSTPPTAGAILWAEDPGDKQNSLPEASTPKPCMFVFFFKKPEARSIFHRAKRPILSFKTMPHLSYQQVSEDEIISIHDMMGCQASASRRSASLQGALA